MSFPEAPQLLQYSYTYIQTSFQLVNFYFCLPVYTGCFPLKISQKIFIIFFLKENECYQYYTAVILSLLFIFASIYIEDIQLGKISLDNSNSSSSKGFTNIFLFLLMTRYLLRLKTISIHAFFSHKLVYVVYILGT